MEADASFDIFDYVIFGGMLLVSALIGVYFAFLTKNKQNTVKEYLLGGKKMGIFPISMSLVASSFSGVAIIGYPAEMYTFGTQLWTASLGEICAHLVAATVFLPVLFKLEVITSYEYLERRFNSTLRKIGSLLFIIRTICYVPVVIYVPALALAQATGMSLSLLIPLISIVCIFYTTLGGLKAVAWADTLQTMLMFFGVVVISVIGTAEVGGIGAVWEANRKTGRMEFFNFDPNPLLRHTFWTVMFGRFFQILSSSTVSQSFVQRYLSMPTLKDAQIAIVILALGAAALASFCSYTGLVVFAAFQDCDPVTVKTISSADNLLLYFVLKYSSGIPAYAGIFFTGVFSASLSSMSTCLNSTAGVIFEDFIRPIFRKRISEARCSFYMKVIVVIIGVATTVLACIVDKLEGLIQATGSLMGVTTATLLGLYFLGMLCPWANSMGALAGSILSAVFVGWMCIGTQIAVTKKQITFPTKPISIEGCDNATLAHYHQLMANYTKAAATEVPNEPFSLYTVSYMYYPVFGFIICVVFGLVASCFTGMNKPHTVNPDLLSPLIHRYISFIDEDVLNKNIMKNHRDSVNIDPHLQEESLSLSDR